MINNNEKLFIEKIIKLYILSVKFDYIYKNEQCYCPTDRDLSLLVFLFLVV